MYLSDRIDGPIGLEVLENQMNLGLNLIILIIYVFSNFSSHCNSEVKQTYFRNIQYKSSSSSCHFINHTLLILLGSSLCWVDLPHDVREHVLLFLSKKDIIRFLQVSKNPWSNN